MREDSGHFPRLTKKGLRVGQCIGFGQSVGLKIRMKETEGDSSSFCRASASRAEENLLATLILRKSAGVGLHARSGDDSLVLMANPSYERSIQASISFESDLQGHRKQGVGV